METNEIMTIDILRSALSYVKGMPMPTQKQLGQFFLYNDMLLDYNSRVNLTRIVAPVDVAQKHFADSLLPVSQIPYGSLCVDVGTGAGFPGIPLKIMRPDIRLTLIDSLAKRIKFLNLLCQELGITAVAIHARAEDAARMLGLRASFDIALTRAVASTSIVTEITVPFLKKGGASLMYKSGEPEIELANAQNAIALLNSSAKPLKYDVPWGNRTVLVVKKLGDTPRTYPRKPNIIEKAPL